MDAHSTLNDLKYPRTDWGLRSGAILALILCSISVVAILANPNSLIASPAGFFIGLTLSCLTGGAFGYAIQMKIAKREAKDIAEIRELRALEVERQLREFREAKEK